MLLEKNENILVGKLIGLLNGLEADQRILEIKDEIVNFLMDIKNKNNLDHDIDDIIKLKEKYLPDCLSCSSPCGRTNDFYLNDQSEEKRNYYFDFLNSFNEKMSIDDIAYYLTRLIWI